MSVMRSAWLLVGSVAMAACSLTMSLDGLSGGAQDADSGPAEVVSSTPGDAGAKPDAPIDGNAKDSSSSSPYRDLILSDGPVAYYRLGDTENSVKDEIAGHDGTVIGSVSHGPGAIAGDPDQALVGTGQGWIDIAQIYPFSGNAVYSIEAWVSPQQSSTLTGVLSRNIATPGNPPVDGYSLYIGNGDLSPIMGRWLTNNQESASGPGLTPGTFAHVVGTYDGMTLRVYVNGVLVGNGSSTQMLSAPSTDLAIAATRNGTYGYFVGSLDEIALYDKVLPIERIAAHYAAGSGN